MQPAEAGCYFCLVMQFAQSWFVVFFMMSCNMGIGYWIGLCLLKQIY